MHNFILVLIVGAIMGAMFDILALWLPYRINQEEARWIAEVLNEKNGQVVPVTFQSILRVRSYRSPEQWMVILLSIIAVFICSLHFGWSAKAIGFMFFACGMIALAIIDQRTKYLPDQLTLPMMWLGLLIQLNPATKTVGIENAVLGAVFGYLILWIVAYLFYKLRGLEGLGHGDMKLMAIVGAWLGPLSIPTVIFFASLLAVIYQFVAIIRKKTHSQDQFPFGPWLVTSALFYLFLG